VVRGFFWSAAAQLIIGFSLLLYFVVTQVPLFYAGENDPETSGPYFDCWDVAYGQGRLRPAPPVTLTSSLSALILPHVLHQATRVPFKHSILAAHCPAQPGPTPEPIPPQPVLIRKGHGVRFSYSSRA